MKKVPTFIKIEVEKIYNNPPEEADNSFSLVKVNIITTPAEVVIRAKINIKFKNYLKLSVKKYQALNQNQHNTSINDVETIMLNGESLMSISSTYIIYLKLNYFYEVDDGTSLIKESFDEKLRAKSI